jgi:hypothetical protein
MSLTAGCRARVVLDRCDAGEGAEEPAGLTRFQLLNVTPSSAPITELPLALVPTATVPLFFVLHITSVSALGQGPRQPASQPTHIRIEGVAQGSLVRSWTRSSRPDGPAHGAGPGTMGSLGSCAD